MKADVLRPDESMVFVEAVFYVKQREVFYRERKRKSLAEIKVTDLCALAEVSHSSVKTI